MQVKFFQERAPTLKLGDVPRVQLSLSAWRVACSVYGSPKWKVSSHKPREPLRHGYLSWSSGGFAPEGSISQGCPMVNAQGVRLVLRPGKWFVLSALVKLVSSSGNQAQNVPALLQISQNVQHPHPALNRIPPIRSKPLQSIEGEDAIAIQEIWVYVK